MNVDGIWSSLEHGRIIDVRYAKELAPLIFKIFYPEPEYPENKWEDISDNDRKFWINKVGLIIELVIIHGSIGEISSVDADE